MEEIFYYKSKFGLLKGCVKGDKLVYLKNTDTKENSNKTNKSKFAIKIEKELDEYFNGKRTKFTIPINTIGTEFQKQVWNKLTEIPYGTTISYKELATSVKGKNYSRAVGMANNRNPIPIIIPCHRVVGTKGELVGYRGGVDIKEKLINLEKQLINKRR